MALHSSDDRLVIAFVSRAVNAGLIPSRVKQVTTKLVFTGSLLDAQHERDCVENKPESLLVPLRKAVIGIPLRVADKWLATTKGARHGALIAFSW